MYEAMICTAGLLFLLSWLQRIVFTWVLSWELTLKHGKNVWFSGRAHLASAKVSTTTATSDVVLKDDRSPGSFS